MSCSRPVSAVTGPVRVFQIALTVFFGRMAFPALAADEVSQNEPQVLSVETVSASHAYCEGYGPLVMAALS